MSKSGIYDCLIPLMKAKGATATPEEFHHAVNLSYHRFESKVYDEGHREMWESLPMQFELLATDVLQRAEAVPAHIRMLDIGCGTGLSSTLLLRTELGRRVKKVDLLDTSPEMLQKCAERAASWNVEHQVQQGTLEKAPAGQYDLILVSSVLHHIPDLPEFLRQVRARQKKGGILFHIQDPNGDYLQDPELLRRRQTLNPPVGDHSPSRGNRWLAPLRLAKRGYRKLMGSASAGPTTFFTEVNDELLKSGVIQKPMTSDEIWSVTDIHVEGLPFSSGEGISLRRFKTLLPEYKLLSARSYAFFGKLWSRLPESFQQQEMDLIQQNAPNGNTIAAVWQRLG